MSNLIASFDIRSFQHRNKSRELLPIVPRDIAGQYQYLRSALYDSLRVMTPTASISQKSPPSKRHSLCTSENHTTSQSMFAAGVYNGAENMQASMTNNSNPIYSESALGVLDQHSLLDGGSNYSTLLQTTSDPTNCLWSFESPDCHENLGTMTDIPSRLITVGSDASTQQTNCRRPSNVSTSASSGYLSFWSPSLFDSPKLQGPQPGFPNTSPSSVYSTQRFPSQLSNVPFPSSPERGRHSAVSMASEPATYSSTIGPSYSPAREVTCDPDFGLGIDSHFCEDFYTPISFPSQPMSAGFPSFISNDLSSPENRLQRVSNSPIFDIPSSFSSYTEERLSINSAASKNPMYTFPRSNHKQDFLPPHHSSSFPSSPLIPIREFYITPSSDPPNDCCPFPNCKRKSVKDLKAHILSHQNDRPEKCSIPSCSYHTKGFARRYDRNRHFLTHLKEIMVCGFCSASTSLIERSFNRTDLFKKHLISEHNAVNPEHESAHQVKISKRNLRATSPAASRISKRQRRADDSSSIPPPEHDQKQVKAQCSVCLELFDNVYEFYRHLDDCVCSRISEQQREKEKGEYGSQYEDNKELFDSEQSW